jgi:uncharacterized protein
MYNKLMQQKKPIAQIVFYILITYAISWSIWGQQALAKLGMGESSISMESPLMLVAVWGPSLAAIILTLITTGGKGLKELLGKLFAWKVPIQWYIFALGITPLLWFCAYGIDRLLGFNYELKQLAVINPAFLPFLIIFSLPNAAGEEIGWRGYMQQKLQTICTPLISGLIVGIVWASWHIPTWIAQGISVDQIVVLFPHLISSGLLFAWLFNKTNKSLLLVTLFHASTTLTGYLLPQQPTITFTILFWIVTLFLIMKKK